MELLETRDIGPAAYLLAKGQVIHRFTKEGGLTVFSFRKTESTQQLIEEYYSADASINPMLYHSAIKTIKNMIHRTDLAVPSQSKATSYVKQSHKPS